MSTNFNTLGFIQANSLTYTEIKQDISDFVDALSEDEKLGFKSLFAGTNSQILIDILAASDSAEIYHIIISRAENLLYYCSRRDSATAIAQNYSYSPYRGSNIRLQLTLVPNQTISLPKMVEIAISDEYSLIITEPLELIENEPITFDAYLGTIKEQTLVADTEDLLIFRFTNQKVSEQIALYINGSEVPHTTNILEMLDDKYFAISNAYQSVDVLYLNKRRDFTHRYASGDRLTLRYIEYDPVNLNSIEVQSQYGDITEIKQVSPSISPESVTQTKVNGPLYAQTQNRIVARDDFPKVFQESNPEIIDAKGTDYSPAIVDVTYVKRGGSLLSDLEYQRAYDNLSGRRGFGIPMCILSHPDVMLNLNVTVALKLTSTYSSVIGDYVREVLSNWEYKLGQLLDFSKIEHALEGYSFTETARILMDYEPYQGGIYAPEGTTFRPTTPNGKLYVVRNPLSLTGSTEPNWPREVGATIEDNDIIWECQLKSLSYQPLWMPDYNIKLHNVVWPNEVSNAYQYKCIGFTYRNGSTEPTWPNRVGDTVVDGQILWVAIDKDITADAWQGNQIITRGTIVNPTDEEATLSFQAINYVPKTPTTEPDWDTQVTLFTDKGIQYSVIDEIRNDLKPSLSNIQLNWNQYVKFNEKVQVV